MNDSLSQSMAATIAEKYSLSISVDPDYTAFAGSVSVQCRFTSGLEEIELHSNKLEIGRCVDSNGRPLVVKVDRRRQLIQIPLRVTAGSSEEITIDFSGELDGGMAGLYRSRLGGGFCAVTQFEERDARRAFPCIDHPGRKSIFDVTLTAPKGASAISNTEAIRIDSATDGANRYAFRSTPPMSTYLLFFGIGPFAYLEDPDSRVPIRVAGTEERVETARRSIGFAREAIAFLEEFTGVPYPIDKLDLIAVPDFAFGAMENFGAITFRENYLYLDAATATQSNVESVATIIAHEIAHMWFGDYVSPADWSYVWLNEAFATYFASLVIDAFHPDWKALEAFVDSKQGAMERDGLEGTVPIEFEPGEFTEIDPSTAPIIYRKAGALLHMIHSSIDDDRFRAGIREFLRVHANGVATTDDFLESFARGAGEESGVILRRWVRQKGLPLLTAERSGSQIRVEQGRFVYPSVLSDPSPAGTSSATPSRADTIREDDHAADAATSATSESESEAWPIPVSLLVFTKDGKRTLTTMVEETSSAIQLPSGTLAYKLNREESGYFRTAYSPSDLEALLPHLAQLSEVERAGLFGDLGALHLKGVIPTSSLLDLVESAVADELSELPIRAVTGILSRCADALPLYETRAKGLLGGLLSGLLDAIGHEPRSSESPSAVRSRNHALFRLSRLAGERPAKLLESKFALHRMGEEIEADLIPSALQFAAFAGLEGADWFVDQIDDDSTSETLKRHLIAAAAWFGGSELEKILEHVRTRLPVKNRPLAVGAISANPASWSLLLPWLERSVHELRKMHTYAFAAILVAALPVAGIGRYEEAQSFAARSFAGQGIDGPLQMALERLSMLEAFVQRNATADRARSS